MNAPTHAINWLVGWWLVLAAFATGAAIGLFFHRPDFLGGYDAFRRRILRLGHIALAALGMLNVIYAISPWPVAGDENAISRSSGENEGASVTYIPPPA